MAETKAQYYRIEPMPGWIGVDIRTEENVSLPLIEELEQAREAKRKTDQIFYEKERKVLDFLVPLAGKEASVITLKLNGVLQTTINVRGRNSHRAPSSKSREAVLGEEK